MLTAELATMHGYANVMVKGHAKERAREWRKLGRAPEATGKGRVEGWKQLATKFGEMGWSVQPGGERWVAE